MPAEPATPLAPEDSRLSEPLSERANVSEDISLSVFVSEANESSSELVSDGDRERAEGFLLSVAKQGSSELVSDGVLPNFLPSSAPIDGLRIVHIELYVYTPSAGVTRCVSRSASRP